MQKAERIEWIDICKLSAIFLVVLLHFGTPSQVDDLVHIFHMPVFFFLSGFCFDEVKHKSFVSYTISGIKKLIVPYILFAVFFYVIWTFIYFVIMPDRCTSLHKFLVTLLLTNTDPVLYLWGAVQWFLTSLFFTQLIFWLVCKVVSNEYFRFLLSAAISVTYICLFDHFGFVRLPLAFDTSIVSLCFYSAGHFCSKKKLIDEMKVKSLAVQIPLLSVILFIIYYFFGTINLRTIDIPYPFVFIAGGITGSLVMIMISVLMTGILKRGFSDSGLYKDLLYIGQNTIAVLFIHRFFDGIDKTILDLAEISFENVTVKYLYFAFMTLLFFAVCKYPIRLINKFIPFMLGKRNE